MQSTMQKYQLGVGSILRQGAAVYPDSQVITATQDGTRRASFAEVAARARRLAAALSRLGVRAGDRVATFCWNSQEHLEAYLAVPAMGAVLHTINIRLAADDIRYIVEHARDRVLIADASLLPALPEVPVEHLIVIGDAARGRPYEDLVAADAGDFDWPEIDENEAAAMCYTSGTTGRPKGVVYSHRSTHLHSMAVCAGNVMGLGERDRVLPIVPMFHANAWGLPYAAFQCGADLLMPDRFAQAARLARLIASEQPTITAAVPTVLRDLLAHGETVPLDLASLRMVLCGGSAVPAGLMQAFEQRYGVPIIQGWGLTETSPVAALAIPPKGTAPADAMFYRRKAGRVVAGVEARIVDDQGNVLPWDGHAEGEIEVRGPWVTGAYYGEPTPEKFHDGWLRTGDVGTLHPRGFIEITDRAKDVIKSGGEWISSVALENALMDHPDVREAAVIAVPDDRWQERPLACVVSKSQVSANALRAHLADRFARWWLPERWTFLGEIPKTSVGKFDKKVLRAHHWEGRFEIITVSECPSDPRAPGS